MESPERHPFTTSIDSQDSPLFAFLNTLSPIKSIKSVHAFSELNFPPPPSVFVTPRIHAKSPLQGSKSKRLQAHSESAQNSIQIDSSSQDFCFMVQGKGRSLQDQGQSSHLPCTHSSKGVESQIAECTETKSNVGCSSLASSVSKGEHDGLAHKRAVKAENLEQCTSLCSLGIEATVIAADGLCKLLDSVKNEDQRATLECSLDTLQANQLQESLTAADLSCYSKLSNTEALDPGQDAAAGVHKMSYLNVNSEERKSGALSSLSDLSIQYLAGSLLTVNTSTQEVSQNGQVDCLPTGTKSEYKDDRSINDPRHLTASKVDCPIQRGFRRRCLDFRVSDSRRLSKSPPLLKSNSCSRSEITPPSSSDSNMHVTTLRERTLAMSADAAGNNDSICLSQCHLLTEPNYGLPEAGLQPCPSSGTFFNSANMQCGIGLHLNSLSGRMPHFQSSRGENGDAGYLTSVKQTHKVIGAMPPSRMQSAYQPGEVLSLPSSTRFGTRLRSGPSFEEFENSLPQETNIEEQLVISLVQEMEMDLRKDHSVKASEAVAHVDSRNSRLNKYEPFGVVEETLNPLDQEMVSLPSMDVDGGQEGNSLSGRKARKRASIAESSETGCKRCNCKKSKCLKLYCECFAAGLFCVDNCSCQDCHNKPSFEETVLETRQQIESRNPLAFAPRVVQALAQSPIGEKTSDFTPSARHKKGCSCKKSKCLKKYCECYQAGVGCSEGCRCEDCQNLYGKKEGFEGLEGNDDRLGIYEKDVAEEKIDNCCKFDHMSNFQHDDLSPITPSFQSAGQTGSLTMQRVTRRRCLSTNEQLQSPDSNLLKLKPLKICKAAQNSFAVPKSGRRLSSSPVSTCEALKSRQTSSPGWDGLGDFCTLTPLPQAPQLKTTSSTSFSHGTDSSPSVNVQQSYGASFSGGDSVSSTVCTGGAQPLMGFHSNPRTRSVNALLCGIGPDTPCGDSSVSKTGLLEDDTFPEILKEVEPVRPSLLSLKSNSPKQKRVSPPHFVGLRITSQQSPTLRNGRKFTLQSISSTCAVTKSAV